MRDAKVYSEHLQQITMKFDYSTFYRTQAFLRWMNGNNALFFFLASLGECLLIHEKITNSQFAIDFYSPAHAKVASSICRLALSLRARRATWRIVYCSSSALASTTTSPIHNFFMINYVSLHHYEPLCASAATVYLRKTFSVISSFGIRKNFPFNKAFSARLSLFFRGGGGSVRD